MTSWSLSICKALHSLEGDKNFLPLYDDESIQQTKNIIEEIQNTIQLTQERTMASIVLKQYADRLQHGIDIYIQSRINRIMELHSQNNTEFRKNMSSSEVDFLNEYKRTISDYKKELGFDPQYKCKPPKGLNAEVVVLKDAETIPIGNIFILLKQNEVLLLRTTEAEELERLGLVKIREYLK